MRCARCGRRERRLRDARGPDGRLVFGWCADCLAEAHLRALGLLPPEDPAATPGPSVRPFRISATAGDERTAGLRGLGALLVTWGLLLELVGAGSWLGLGRPDDGFGPTRISRVQIFSVAGAVLAIAGRLDRPGVARPGRAEAVDRPRRRGRGASGSGLCVLVVGIAFHDPRRDPWVVAAVVLAAVAARAARLWSRPREPRRPAASPGLRRRPDSDPSMSGTGRRWP